MVRLIHIGDCLEVMKSLDAGSIDAIVTDPPYGLSFMGKDWDKGVPGVPFWQEALRVAKPGCHILAAGGSRTYHRLAVAIEDAGWEIRDCVMWIYGSGFPKSHDVSKAIDREAGVERSRVDGPQSGGMLAVNNRNAGQGYRPNDYGENGNSFISGDPITEAAKQWQGWGTALKPAFEPFILARKPLDGTVAQNVQRHGCGGLNVDGCRVGSEKRIAFQSGTPGAGRMRACNLVDRGDGKTPDGRCLKTALEYVKKSKTGEPKEHCGRWPANVIHDGSDKVMAGFGSAARFFYCPKASKSEREAGLDQTNHHPTVKPVALMAYLCRLITPPNGTILDPFCGSGSTGVAAVREGFNFIGIELNPEYAEIATRRIENEKQKTALLK